MSKRLFFTLFILAAFSALFLSCSIEEEQTGTYTVIYDSNNGTGETKSCKYFINQEDRLELVEFIHPVTDTGLLYFVGCGRFCYF